jgi:dephospho-CoA kinase
MKIGITGSISSGKSTVSNLFLKDKNLIFSADKIVKDLYNNNDFKKKISKRFKIRKDQIKKEIKKKLLTKKITLKSLGKIVHPIVRKKMLSFYKKNKHKNVLVFEIPLLIENKLMNFFDFIILVTASRKIRLRRYIKNGGDKKLFNILDKEQLSSAKKSRFCNYIIVNNKSKIILKKKVNAIIE